MTLNTDAKFEEKKDSWFQKWNEEFGKFSLKHSRVQKFHLNGLFLSKIYEIELKKYRRAIFHDTDVMQNSINPDLVVSQIAWGIGWTFIRALKSLKNCTLMGSFCLKNVMFQLENFRGIMCHDTEKWWQS